MTTSKKRTGIRMPEELDQRLKAIADKQGFTKNAVMLQALQLFVKKYEKGKN